MTGKLLRLEPAHLAYQVASAKARLSAGCTSTQGVCRKRCSRRSHALFSCTLRRCCMSVCTPRKCQLVAFVAAIIVALFTSAIPAIAQQYDPSLFSEMRWRCIGPFRGGRTVAISGVPHQPNGFYMAAVHGGGLKNTHLGHTWP